MNSVFSIELLGLRFHQGHGVYIEEAAIGNEFEVSIRMTWPQQVNEEIQLHDTVDYELAYKLVSEIFGNTTRLLENIAIAIAETLHKQFPQLSAIEISIHKLNPGIEKFSGRAGITYARNFR